MCGLIQLALPHSLATRTFVVVTQLRLYDARITARQFLHAWKTVALIKALLGLRPQLTQLMMPVYSSEM